MRHQPHLYLPGPWPDDQLRVDERVVRHLTKVLRYQSGSPVTYTDGRGATGTGTWTGSGIDRGDERAAARTGRIVDVLVTPPKSKERQRFLVEKCQEIGVRRFGWLRSQWASGRPPTTAKSDAWSIGALEQSRGAWLMIVAALADLEFSAGCFVADAGGTPIREVTLVPGPVTIIVGPEGGFAPGEVDDEAPRVSFGDTTFRTDTAAVVAAAILRLT